MTNAAPAIVQNRDGLLGVLEHPESLRVGSEARVEVRLTDGRVVLVPVDLMAQHDDGSFFLDLSAADVAGLETGTARAAVAAADRPGRGGGASSEGDAVVVPVVAEAVEVEKRLVESGRVRVHKSVETAEEVVRGSLLHEVVDVERVPINRAVDGPVDARQEGDTTVIPVLKEVLVVEKRLMLVEEVRITRRRIEQPFAQTVPLRAEAVVVERDTPAGHPDAGGRSGEGNKLPG